MQQFRLLFFCEYGGRFFSYFILDLKALDFFLESFILLEGNRWTYVNTLDKKSRKIMLLFLVPHPPFAVVSNNQ